MGEPRARLFVAGSGALWKPLVARIDVDGDQAEIHARPYVDPIVRCGRGGGTGVITALTGIRDGEGGEWLLASVERGQPRLLDPDRLGVVALLGRRREWRGSAGVRSPFLSLVADRRVCEVLGQRFMLARSGAEVDLLRVCPGQPLERWWLGRLIGRIELFAGPTQLALVHRDRVAVIDVAELVAGGCPLTDPRDVELALEWSSVPATVVAVVDLLERPLALRVIERGPDPDGWQLTELALTPNGAATRRASWAISRPDRWLSAGDSVWLSLVDGWTRATRGDHPTPSRVGLAGPTAVSTLALDADGHPWLWVWPNPRDARRAELLRVDGLALAEPPRRWSLAGAPIRAHELLASGPTRAGDRSTIVHADELAELLPLEPELEARWRTWFD